MNEAACEPGITPEAGGKLAQTIVLVGLMGAGKSTIGRRLAARLGVPFKDADTEIELAAGKTVSELFAEHGEPYFRAGEQRVIRRLLEDPPHVLATGGGAFMNAATRALIAEKAISVWLRADLDVLVKRVARRNTRPLLANGDVEGTLRRLIAERYPVYAEANFTIDTLDGPHDETVDAILAVLAAAGWRKPAQGTETP